MPVSRIATVTVGEPRRPAAHARSVPIARRFHWRAKNEAVVGFVGLCADPSASATGSSRAASAGTVIVAGGAKEGSEEDNATARPPMGAGPLITTYALVMALPPAIVAGRMIELTAGGVTVTVATFETPL